MRDCIELILNIIVALGTLAVGVLAIWGDWFKDKFAGPRLSINLRSSKGKLALRQNGSKALYYHLLINNDREWAKANGVQIMITSIFRKIADGSYRSEIMVSDLQLTWAFPQMNPINPTVKKDYTCDFGFLDEESDKFKPSLYIYPNNFNGYVHANESVCFGIGVRAENFAAKNTLFIEVSWDGNWTSDLDSMKRHLVVKEVPNPITDRSLA